MWYNITKQEQKNHKTTYSRLFEIPWFSLMFFAILVRCSSCLRTVWLLTFRIFKQNLILSHFVFKLFEFVFTLFQFPLNCLWIPQKCIALINSFHLYKSISCSLLLLDFLLKFLNLCYQFLFALWGWQVTEVILWSIGGNRVLKDSTSKRK